jgi:hypothetical protein
MFVAAMDMDMNLMPIGGTVTSLYIVRISPKGLVRFRSLLQESLIGSLQIVSAFEYTLLCPVFQVDVASTSNWAS